MNQSGDYIIVMNHSGNYIVSVIKHSGDCISEVSRSLAVNRYVHRVLKACDMSIVSWKKQVYISLKPIPKEDTLRCWRFYSLGNWQKVADQTSWSMEVNWDTFTSSGMCHGAVLGLVGTCVNIMGITNSTCNVHVSMAVRTISRADLSLTYTSVLLGP